MLILGTFTEMLSPDDARRVADFVAAGGKLILVVPAAQRSAIDLKAGDPLPAFGFDTLAGCKALPTLGRGGINPNAKLVCGALGPVPALPTGDLLGPLGNAGHVLDPAADAHPFVTVEGSKFAMAVASADFSVVTLALGGIGYPGQGGAPGRDTYLRSLLAGLLGCWKVDSGYALTGATQRDKMSVGLLEGKGYWLAGVTNNADAAQSRPG